MADLRASLTRVYEKNGELTPQIVVDEARPETSELHHRFEWDDAVAGEAYRRTQAAELIRSVRIAFSDNKTGERKHIRAFHSLRESGEAERAGYVPTEEIVQDELATKILQQAFKREIADLKRKYGHLEDYIAWVRGEAEELAS
ncbi:hypothetical protein [Mycolicibacterium canariasense]|uniref:hypothetical protein n=1 Tax=Mycolicibacterium canariasense TaxID=228230 RepID=UPI0032D5AC56